MSDIVLQINENQKVFSIKNDGKYKKIIYDALLDDMSEESVQKIFNNANKVLRQCLNPYIDSTDSKTGIVIGKVQSGKTSNFISLVALGFDNNYKISIVFGGNKKNLANQNAKRISENFSSSSEEVVILSTEKNEGLIESDELLSFLDQGKRIVIVALKHSKHINMLRTVIENTALEDIPMLLIDDEGDQATLNTQYKKNGQSSTYSSFLKLRSVIKKHAFLSVTATPQANLLIKSIDNLSPDFCVLTYPGDDYCGLETFHGSEQYKYIRVIEEDEPDICTGKIPESFIKAFAIFFVGGAIRKYRGDCDKHSFLVHPSQKIDDHKIVVNAIKNLKEKWTKKAQLQLKGISDISYKNLRKILLDAYKDIRTYNNSIPAFEDIEKDILDIITKCSPPLICNSTSDATENSKYYNYCIHVGGNMVERGLTIKGLAVTYLTRRAKTTSNVDNTEQRARWFGYKRNFIDVCRVYITRKIKDDFSKIYEHDEDLWSMIERHLQSGKPFKDMPRLFRLSSDVLRMCRLNVASTSKFDYSQWTKGDCFLMNEGNCKFNINLISNFRNKYAAAEKSYSICGKLYNNYKFINNLKFNEVYEDLLSIFKYSPYANLNLVSINNIHEGFIKLKLNTNMNVLFVRDDSVGEREIVDKMTGKINNLFEGRRINVTNSSFPGDSSLPNEFPDEIQLQVHFIKPNNIPEIKYYSVILALYIPDKYAGELSKLVGRSN